MSTTTYVFHREIRKKYHYFRLKNFKVLSLELCRAMKIMQSSQSNHCSLCVPQDEKT